MLIEICSRDRAMELISGRPPGTAVISITSLDEAGVNFAGCVEDQMVLPMKFNDLKEEYDEEGIPYGRPLPAQKDFEGLRDFTDSLSCGHLIVHCWEGCSRSAAVAAAVYESRGGTDVMTTHQDFRPNPLVYRLACRELGLRPGSCVYRAVPVPGEADAWRLEAMR